jgi:hypothetical protein
MFSGGLIPEINLPDTGPIRARDEQNGGAHSTKKKKKQKEKTRRVHH